MYCTEAESCFRPCSNRPSSLDLFGPASHSSSFQSSPQQIPNALGYGYEDSSQQPKRLQEEDLIGRLDECVSDANSANYSPVDCTLSLGTPSTRYSSTKQGAFTGSMEGRDIASDPFKGTCASYTWNNSSSNNVSWQAPLDYSRDMSFANAKQGRPTTYGNMFNQNSVSNGRMIHKSGRNGSENISSVGRKCANCDTTTTPLWRNGPKGPKSLCNACGIRYKKEERRTAACTDPHQTKKNNQDDIYENSYNMNMIHGCCTDDMTTNTREASCLTWQGSSCVYLQRPNSLLSMHQAENNIPRTLPTSSYADEGPTLLFGRSVD
ncbi:hypothetical protein SUGI_0371780 [Cryptomeria japonica]|uniref:uncharacterized protein LOC131061150 n=1 Tax=Cryptomeria japonica TaxID=3369 RepID=UPI002408CF56|nr:uncharacterized protein LOC131061150 [Cryptomeria japonica]GLJ20447.1 hypothetical protein SUGI_0371780 [Cryptomeria japonica]